MRGTHVNMKQKGYKMLYMIFKVNNTNINIKHKELTMAHLFIKHKVDDYAAWKKIFDDFVETRRAGGEKSYQILHWKMNPTIFI